jgi:hypothetical protein
MGGIIIPTRVKAAYLRGTSLGIVCGLGEGRPDRPEDPSGARGGRRRSCARLGEITFSRVGRTGTRTVRVSTRAENTVSTVSIVGATRRDQPARTSNIGCRRC